MYLRVAAVLFLVFLLGSCADDKQDSGFAYRPEVFTAKWMAGMFDPVSRVFLLVGEQGSIARSENGYDWDYADTPTVARLNNIGSDAQTGVLVAVGDADTVLRSKDGGRTWVQPEIVLPEGVSHASIQLKAIVYHPASKAWLAAGTHNAILRSVDQGKSWRMVSYDSSDRQLEILALYVEPQTEDLLLAAQHGTMGRSHDGGVSWDIVQHDMEAPGNYIPHIVGFYHHNNVLIASADLGRLLVSTDAGKNWRLLKLPTAGYFTDSAYDPVHHSIVMTTQEGEIVYSKDDGRSWKLVTFPVRNWPSDDIPFLSSIVYDAKTRSLLVMGNSGIVARSMDGGESWQADILKPLFDLSLTTLLHDPERNLFVAAGLGGFIVAAKGLTPDPRAGWDLVRPGIDLYMREVVNIPGSNTFVVVGQLGGVWRSEDDGRSWNVIEPKYPYPNQPPHLRDVIIDPQSGALVAAGPDGSIMRSTDAGKTWRSVFQGLLYRGEAFTQILVDKKRNTLIACEALYHSVYISSDGGASWDKAAKIPTDGRNVWYGAILGKKDLLVVTGQKGAVSVSRDGGHSWVTMETGASVDFYGAFADEAGGALFVVGANGVILRSENGRQWQSVNSGTNSTLRRMFADPKTGALLAIGQEGTILRSVDGGRQWSRAVTPPVEAELRKMLVEPDSHDLVVIGRDGVILRSEDGGENWLQLPSHTREHLRSAAFNPATGTLIAVGDGLIRLSRHKSPAG